MLVLLFFLVSGLEQWRSLDTGVTLRPGWLCWDRGHLNKHNTNRYISSAYFSLIRTATTLYSRHDGTVDTIAIAEILHFQSYVFHVQSVFHVVNFTDDCS